MKIFHANVITCDFILISPLFILQVYYISYKIVCQQKYEEF
nr:MAG TPA: hypothetical protein [Caudoviricetes sp.]